MAAADTLLTAAVEVFRDPPGRRLPFFFANT
jgi:hypothetical protein